MAISCGVFDMLDGAVARAAGKAGRFGTVLDHVLDRYAEFLIIIGIVLGEYVGWFWGMFCLFGMVMASFTRAKAESVGGLSQCEVGVAERQEKFVLLLGGAIGSVFYSTALEIAVIVVGSLSHVTVAQRLAYSKKRIGM